MATVEKLTLNITEAAAMLGVSRPSMYNILHRDGFPSFKIGGRVMISRAGLERWVDEQAAKGVM